MNRYNIVVNARIAVIGIAVAILCSGCSNRVKGFESFQSATQPVKFKDRYEGDKYSNGGIADATGGKDVSTQYGVGAKTGAEAKMNPAYDQPAKGTGQLTGENPGTKPSSGNGPIMQPEPGQASTLAGNVRG
jgi:hypothetical protein